MRIRVHAAHVVPIVGPPRRHGSVDVEGGRVVAVNAADTPAQVDEDVHLGDAVLMPGLVNAHTHLELAHLRDRVPPATAFTDWVRSLLAARAEAGEPSPAVLDAALASMRASGTVACGDIGNTEAALPALARAGMTAVHFSEVLGFRADESRAAARWAAVGAWEPAPVARVSARVVRGVAPHAPYSTSPSLIAGVVTGLDEAPQRRASIHLGESPEELRFLRHGDGPWREILEAFGSWDPGWSPPGCSPVRYLDAIGALHPRLLVVHGTHLPDDDFARLAAAGCTLVVCARSNRWVGVGDPPVSRMVGSRVSLAVGTDSLASAPDLDMFAELAHLRALAGDVPASHLLEAATRGGALALGFDDLGAIAPGMRAELLVVRGPAPADGVEEWLLSGAVTPDALGWLASALPPWAVAATH